MSHGVGCRYGSDLAHCGSGVGWQQQLQLDPWLGNLHMLRCGPKRIKDKKKKIPSTSNLREFFLGWYYLLAVFLFQRLEYIGHFLPAHKISEENSADSLKHKILLSSCSFKDSLLVFNIWQFVYNVSWCGSFWINLIWNFLVFQDLDDCFLLQVTKIFSCYFSNNISVAFLSSSFGTSIMKKCCLDDVP